MHTVQLAIIVPYITGLQVTDSGLHSNTASALPVQVETASSQKQTPHTSKRPLKASDSKNKKRKLQADIQVTTYFITSTLYNFM